MFRLKNAAISRASSSSGIDGVALGPATSNVFRSTLLFALRFTSDHRPGAERTKSPSVAKYDGLMSSRNPSASAKSGAAVASGEENSVMDDDGVVDVFVAASASPKAKPSPFGKPLGIAPKSTTSLSPEDDARHANAARPRSATARVGGLRVTVGSAESATADAMTTVRVRGEDNDVAGSVVTKTLARRAATSPRDVRNEIYDVYEQIV